MQIADAFSLALSSLRQHRLRTVITIAIIALGITALIGIITAIGAMSQKLMETFSSMGASGFTIRHRERNLFGTEQEGRLKAEDRRIRPGQLQVPISMWEAEAFKKNYPYPAAVGLASFAGNRATVKFLSKDIRGIYLFGADEQYLALNGYKLAYGRNFTPGDIEKGAALALVGADVAGAFFENPAAAIGRVVSIEGRNIKVVGVLAARGSTFGFSRDKLVILPYRYIVRYFENRSFTIAVKADHPSQVPVAMGEARGLFKRIRKQPVAEAENFTLDQSNSLAERAMNSMRLLTASVVVIGFITLTGAAIGLMNIMLVAVAERTREIGVLKALGSRSADIRRQFFAESLIISTSGALVGIFFGIVAGNGFAYLLGTSFIMPWSWVLYGVLICGAVGLISGVYPAAKAGKLNPVEALRYE